MRNRGGKPHRLSIGDPVLIQQRKKNKLTPAYDPHPAKVVGVKGSMVSVQTGTKTVTRDGSRFKKLRKEPEAQELSMAANPDYSTEEESIEVENDNDVSDHQAEGNNTHDIPPVAGVSPANEPVTRSRTQRANAGVPAVRFGEWCE